MTTFKCRTCSNTWTMGPTRDLNIAELCHACTAAIIDRQAKALGVCHREAEAILGYSKNKDDRNCAEVIRFHAAKALGRDDQLRHDFEGECAPGGKSVLRGCVQETFSVGIFQWQPRAGGVGVKKGPVKVRVKGPFADPERVYAKAREIIAALNAGTYNGAKTVTA